MRKYMMTGELFGNEHLDVHVGEDMEMKISVREFFNLKSSDSARKAA